MRTLHFSRVIWAVLILGSLSFGGFRVAQLWCYGDLGLIEQQRDDLMRAFFMGARFDFKWLSIGLLVLFVSASLIAIPAFLRRVGGYLQRAAIVILFFAINFAAICQYFYYGFYKTPFSPILFGLYEDDTKGVLASIWGDFPVILALLLVMAITWAQVCFTFWFASASCTRSRLAQYRWWAPAATLLTILALVFFSRGKLGTFPLRNSDSVVCADAFINDSVRNAWQTLQDALFDRGQQVGISKDPTEQLAAYGFNSLEELATVLGARSGSVDDLKAFIFRRTAHKPFVEAHPPHVVFALMESWGAHQLKFDSAQNNLTGALGKYLERDIVFNNFFSSQLLTYPSLEALLLNSPLTPLVQGRNAVISYPASAAKPFKDKGYRTLFLYGGSNTWRAVGRGMQSQYFDKVYDRGDIVRRYPDAQPHAWGVHDEYLFRFAYDLLKEADARGEKVFLFLLTTTNHPPHEMPSDYKRLPLDFSKMRTYFANDAQKSLQMVDTYQYANHQLGQFIDRIEHSPLGKKTLLAAAGDHNQRAMLRYRQPTDSKDLYRIGGYFHIPKAYRPSFKSDPARYAGHRDMFPTLYNLALSNAVYPSFGENLFAALPPQKQFAIVAFTMLFSKEGALLPFVGAHPSPFHWMDASQTTLFASKGLTPLLQAQSQQARAWVALADWYTRYQTIDGMRRIEAQNVINKVKH